MDLRDFSKGDDDHNLGPLWSWVLLLIIGIIVFVVFF
jgi:hypothetical protein